MQNQVSIEIGSGLGRGFCNGFLKKTPPGKFSQETYYLVPVLKKKNQLKSKRKAVFYGNSRDILKLLFLDVFLSLSSHTHESEDLKTLRFQCVLAFHLHANGVLGCRFFLKHLPKSRFFKTLVLVYPCKPVKWRIQNSATGFEPETFYFLAP